MTQSDLKFGRVIDIAGTKAYLLECNGEIGVGFYEKNRCKKKAAMRYLISEGWLTVPKYGWTINNVQIGEE